MRSLDRCWAVPFEHISTVFARLVGRPATLVFSVALAGFAIYAFAHGIDRLEWAASLSISVVTVLLLPLLQATQNRDSAALHAKLDELIKTDAEARNALIGLENRSVEEIETLRVEHEHDLVEAALSADSTAPLDASSADRSTGS